MDWEGQFQRWKDAAGENPYDDRPARLIVIETRKMARNGATLDNTEGWSWVEQALGSVDRRPFIHAVFHRQAAPTRLAYTFLQMAINEQNPSTNRLYVEPAVKALGARRVMDSLVEVMLSGTERESAGAVSAAYWVRGDNSEPRYREASIRFRDAVLRKFIDTESTYLRQRIVPMLLMEAGRYSSDVSRLLPEAIRIARSHPDDYIRHRIEVQLGVAASLRPLPT